MTGHQISMFPGLDPAPTGQIRARQDRAAAHAAKSDVLDAIEQGRSDDVDRLAAAVARVAGRLSTFTTDDVWAELGDDAESFVEPRRLGAAMRRAQRDGLISSTPQFQPSARPICKCRPIRVWTSSTAVANNHHESETP